MLIDEMRKQHESDFFNLKEKEYSGLL